MITSTVKNLIEAHPHPNPLPQGEGTATHGSRISNDARLARNLTKILPLLGERAGVRADMNTNFAFA